REDHRFLDHAFLAAFAVINFFLFLLDEHEVTENVEKTVALQNLFPKIPGAIAGGMLRVARTALDFAGVTSAVERKEMRFLLLQSRGHVNFIGISREMHESA